MEQEETSSLIFFVNGKRILDPRVDPEVTLLTYLRKKLFLTGSKEGCSEGGCGACTVMLSRLDRISGRIFNSTANACLVLAASMHGVAVTTVEGVGSIRSRIHPVQERLAKAHGSQCGFCTPGFVMSMYTLLKNSPQPSIEEIEENLVGNLCRCTGYRPILEGFRTFCPTIPSRSTQGCGKADCCRLQKGNCGQGDRVFTDVLFDSAEFEPYSPSQDVIFPPELIVSANLDEDNLHFRGDRVEFFRPVHFQKLLQLKSKFPEGKLVAGNTEIGIEVKFKDKFYPVLIDITRIKELQHLEMEDEAVVLGTSLTISKVQEGLKEILPTLREFKKNVVESVLEMVSLFGGKQIRNTGTIGGNIATGSPISDIIPILVASKATARVQSLGAERTLDMDDKFYTGYRKSKLKSEEVLTSVKLPFTKKNEYFKWYKQSKRREDDIAIVNAAFKVKFMKGTSIVDDISLAYGGMGQTVVVPHISLRGFSWDEILLEKALSNLSTTLKLDPGAPGGMVEYRQILALSFFFKFHVFVRRMLNLESPSLSKPLSEVELAELEPLKYQSFQSMQICQEVPEDQAPLDPIGRSIPHVSNMKQTTGEAEYIDDMPQLQNELSAAFVTSTKARAEILEIDESEALKMNGVRSFFCARDISASRNLVQADEEMFASKEVNCVGQIVGLILADSHEIAQRAAKFVKIKYGNIKQPILTIEEAIEVNSLWDPIVISKGDLAQGFEQGHHVIEGEVRVGGQEHFYLEPNAHLAVPRDGEELEVFSACQDVKSTQKAVARSTGLPDHRIRVTVKRIGGSFGGKATRATVIGATISFAAHTLQKPVRIVLNRQEDMLITGGRHPMLAKWKVAFMEDGKITALDMKLYANAGWSLDLSNVVVFKAMFMLHGPYSIVNRKLVGYSCKTNLPSNTAFRGFGVPQTSFIVEDIIMRISDFLQRDSKEVKFRNITPDESEVSNALENSIIRRCWEEVLQSSCYDQRLKEIKEANSSSKTVMRGISALPIAYSIGFHLVSPQQAGALVLVYTDGSVLLSHAGVEMGQGLHTKMIQVASRVLEVPIERIFTSGNATDKIPNTSVSAASYSSDLNGMAVMEACQKIMEKVAPYKEKLPEGSWDEWIQNAYLDRVSLMATGFYKAPGTTNYDFKQQNGDPMGYRAFGAAVSEVEIDCLTGAHTLLRTDIVMDVGNSLNPAIDVGQIEGGFLQGVGWLTLEELKYSPEGALLTLGPGSYKIPGIKDIPRIFNVSFLRNSPNPKAVYSSKGVGEPPLLLATSVFSAIKEAIKDYRRSCGLKGAFRLDAPATAEHIRKACPDRLTGLIDLTFDEDYTPWSISV